MSIALLVFGAVLVGFVSGIVVGMRQAMTFLRLADAAAWQYHREELATILHASSAVHDLVQDIVQQAHARIRTLRTQLQDLKEAQR
jgi:TctA family transporter